MLKKMVIAGMLAGLISACGGGVTSGAGFPSGIQKASAFIDGTTYNGRIRSSDRNDADFQVRIDVNVNLIKQYFVQGKQSTRMFRKVKEAGTFMAKAYCESAEQKLVDGKIRFLDAKALQYVNTTTGARNEPFGGNVVYLFDCKEA